MIEKYLAAVSTYARDVDNLILLIAVLVGFWFILCEGMLFWLIVRFRAREGVRADYITGEEKDLKRWITIPHMLVLVCDVFILYGAINVWIEIKQTLPEKPYETVRVIGQQWAWSFVHPGADGKLDTPDDIKTVDELYIAADRPYIYELEARDVLHSFSVPVFRLKQDAIPGRVIKGWFQATETGEYDIQCAEICGIGHGMMAARIIIQTPEQHMVWVAEHSPTAPTALAAR
jgi:cytochrome c oxidase subunit 2